MLQPVQRPPIHSHPPGYIGVVLTVQHQPQLPGDEKNKGQCCPPLLSCLGPEMPPEMLQGWGKGHVLLRCI